MNIITNNNLEENSKEEDEYKNEDDVSEINLEEFGVWQATLCVTVGLTRIVAMWNLLSAIFIVAPTDFICTKRDNTSEAIVKSTCYKDCVQYEFNISVFNTTIISTFGLICEDAWLAAMSQTVLMFGVLVGFVLYTWIADKHGRRNALQLASFQNGCLMLIAMFSINIWVFICVRFLVGITSGGIIIASFIYILDTVEKKFRNIVFSLAILVDGLAQVSLVLFAYFSSTWDILLLEYWAASIVMFLMVLPIPETPRFVMSQGKIEKALLLVTQMARWNRQSTNNIKVKVFKRIEAMKLNHMKELENPRHYIDLFKDKELCLRILNVIAVFAITGCSYFGVNQYSVFLGTNTFLVVVVMGLIQILACISSICFIKFMERRIIITSLFLVASTSMVVLSFVSDGHWSATLLNAIGFLALSTILPIIFVYTSELFPPPLRSLSLRITSISLLLGAMIAPFIATLSSQWIPSLTFAVLAFMAALLSVLLPETIVMDLKNVQ